MTRQLLKYFVYGFVWQTDLRLSSCLTSADGQTDVELRRVHELSEPPANCLFTSPLVRNGLPFLKTYGTEQRLLIRYPGLVDIMVTPRHIHYVPAPDSDMALIEAQCLGPASALWLEFNSILALHTSAVVVDESAIILVESSGSGKSTLAATFLSHQHALLTDDILPLTVTPQAVWGRPGYPQIRLYSDVAQRFVADAETRSSVHPKIGKKMIPVGGSGFGTFHDRPVKISYIYVLNRVGDDNARIAIQDLTPAEGLHALIRGSSAANTLQALGLQAHRLPRLARIVEMLPIRRLTYPSGMHHLNDIYHAVATDVDIRHKKSFH